VISVKVIPIPKTTNTKLFHPLFLFGIPAHFLSLASELLRDFREQPVCFDDIIYKRLPAVREDIPSETVPEPKAFFGCHPQPGFVYFPVFLRNQATYYP